MENGRPKHDDNLADMVKGEVTGFRQFSELVTAYQLALAEKQARARGVAFDAAAESQMPLLPVGTTIEEQRKIVIQPISDIEQLVAGLALSVGGGKVLRREDRKLWRNDPKYETIAGLIRTARIYGNNMMQAQNDHVRIGRIRPGLSGKGSSERYYLERNEIVLLYQMRDQTIVNPGVMTRKEYEETYNNGKVRQR